MDYFIWIYSRLNVNKIMRYFVVVFGLFKVEILYDRGLWNGVFLLYEGCLGQCLFDTETKKIGCFL